MDDEASLIARAQQGDLPSYGALVRQHQQIAYRAAFFVTHDEQIAADTTQEAFLRAYRALGTFKRGQPFRPWLVRIVTNLALDHLKAERRRAHTQERYVRGISMNQDSPSPEHAVAEREKSERLLQAVSELAEDDRMLIVLRYLLELPEAEVAGTLNIPVGTVKSRLHRTLDKLRAIIQRDFPDLVDLATSSG